MSSNSESPGDDGSRSAGEAQTDRASSVTPCRLFRITGRVQGVFFRDSTRQQALKLGLGGSARNMPDGSVEVLACGSQEALDRLGVWLRSGPPMASVSCVEWKDVENQGFRTFTIVRKS